MAAASEEPVFRYNDEGKAVEMEEVDVLSSDDEEDTTPYYWEENGDETISNVKKCGQTLHWAGSNVLSAMEFVGEIFVSFLGLDQSKYQWVADAVEREQEEQEQLRKEQQQRRELVRAQQAADAAATAGAAEGGELEPLAVPEDNTTDDVDH